MNLVETSQSYSSVQTLANKVMHELENIPENEIPDYEKIFDKFECWTPYLKILSQKLNSLDIENIRLENYIKFIQIQHVHLKSEEKALSMSKRLISDKQLEFKYFHEIFLSKIINQNYLDEAKYLEIAAEEYKDKNNLIPCLERLSFIYGKKLFNDSKLKEIFKRIISIDPHHIKTLKHLKAHYIQAGNWEKAAESLEKCLLTKLVEYERQETAKELASIQLYQLLNPANALSTLDKFFSISNDSIYTLRFDANKNLQNFEPCLEILSHWINIESDKTKESILLYNKAKIYEKILQFENADKCYEHAFQLWPQFLEPLESRINIAINCKNWNDAIELLNKAASCVHGDQQKTKINNLIEHLRNCMKYAK